MKRMCLLAVVLLASLGPTGVEGQQAETVGTGNQLVRDCEQQIRWLDGESLPTDSDSRRAYCMGLVRGVFDMSGFLGAAPSVCYDEGVIAGQAVRVTLRYLNDHPERLHERDTLLVLAALQDAFPCQ